MSGVDPSWVEAPNGTARIFPEAFETVTITFKPPRAAGVAAGEYPFTVTGISADNPSLTHATTGTPTIDAFVDFGLDLASPRQVTGEVEGVFTLKLTNTGNARLTIALDAAEETGRVVVLIRRASSPGRRWRDEAGDLYCPSEEIVSGRQRSIRSPSAARSSMSRHLNRFRRTRLAKRHLSPSKRYLATRTACPHTSKYRLSGQHAQTELVLRNRSAIPMVMTLQANDKASALAFEFVGGDRVTVPEQDALRASRFGSPVSIVPNWRRRRFRPCLR